MKVASYRTSQHGLSTGAFGFAFLLGPAGGESGHIARSACVLIVEDDYLVALELEHRLTQAGFDLAGIAATAEEALELAAAKSPEVAIMDIRLAGVTDGVDVAMELMDRFSIPSIFATAHGDPATKKRAERAKPLGWLEKPYSADELITLINAALSTDKSTKG